MLPIPTSQHLTNVDRHVFVPCACVSQPFTRWRPSAVDYQSKVSNKSRINSLLGRMS